MATPDDEPKTAEEKIAQLEQAALKSAEKLASTVATRMTDIGNTHETGSVGPKYFTPEDEIATIQEKAAQAKNAFNDRVDTKTTSEHTTEKGVKYHITETGVVRDNVLNINTTALEPKRYRINNNGKGQIIYKAGYAASTTAAALDLTIRNRLKEVATDQDIYNDLIKRQAGGETLSQAENNFMNKHQETLKEYTIEMTPDGNLVQKNPKGLQMTPTEVKDMKALEKQIENDIKAAAKEKSPLPNVFMLQKSSNSL